jgi:hypothetical protein
MPRLRPWSLLVPVLLTLLPAVVAAQSARSVLERMVAEHDRRAEGIDNYTLVQDVMGQTMTMYYEKDVSGAHPVFRPRKVTGMGATAHGSAAGNEDEFWEKLPAMLERARSGGQETVDGHATEVVVIDDLAESGFGASFAPGNADFTPQTATLYVDPELWIPRRMVFTGVMKAEGRTSDITITMDAQDIRDVDGLLQPFHTLVRVDGLGQAIDPKMRQQYEQMQKQLADMPESQRQMAEKMMKGRMEQIEQMMNGDGGMNLELVVRELRVNAGPPK